MIIDNPKCECICFVFFRVHDSHTNVNKNTKNVCMFDVKLACEKPCDGGSFEWKMTISRFFSMNSFLEVAVNLTLRDCSTKANKCLEFNLHNRKKIPKNLLKW